MKRVGVSRKLVKEWSTMLQTEFDRKCTMALIDYEPTVTSKELIDEGFVGRALGLEMKKREADKFIELIE